MPRRKNQSARPISEASELPPCPGPKLKAFKHQKAPIEWLERLDENRTEHSGIEASVFRVRIRSQEYAVKVFKFFDPETTRWYWEKFLGDSFPIETVVFHTDPFYAECRAYGRIEEAQIKGSFRSPRVIPCHGFLFLKDKDKQLLQGRGIDLGSGSDLIHETGGNDRVRAIVKSLASPDPGVNSTSLRGILSDIRWLRKLQIYNRDIRVENFRDGKLIDFGSAATEPHCILSAFDKAEAIDARLEDLILFDNMVTEEDIKTQIRAMPNRSHCRKLRSWDR